MINPKMICLLWAMYALSYSFSQVRLNEISPSIQAGKKQWIELFVASGTISDYKVLVKYKSGSTDSGFYVFALSGNPNGGGYFVIGNNNGNTVWQGTSLSKKISWDGRELPFSAAESNFVMSDVGTNHIFLLRGNKIVDALITGISNTATPLSVLQLELNAWKNFNVINGIGFDGLSVDFQLFQLTNLNTFLQPSGNNTVSFIYNTQCPSSSPWILTPVDTRDKLNSGSVNPTIDFWETDFKISSTINRGPSDFYSVPNNTIPGGSPTFDYANAFPTKLYFKYSLNNYTIPVDASNPLFKLYYDKGAALDLPNKILDPSDPEISVSASRSFESPNTVYVNVPISPDMFYIDNNGVKKLRPFFPQLTSLNACFKTQSILLAAPLEALPINLLSFSVSQVADGIQLDWLTSSEENAMGFEIQRAIGKPDRFLSLDFVPTKHGNGSSRSVMHYKYNDNEFFSTQVVYYRIKLVDRDGTASYSSIESFRLASTLVESSLFPNPSDGAVNLITKPGGRFRVYIYDHTGREIRQLNCMQEPVSRITGLKQGFYTVKFIDLTSGSQNLKRLIVN